MWLTSDRLAVSWAGTFILLAETHRLLREIEHEDNLGLRIKTVYVRWIMIVRVGEELDPVERS